MGRDRHREREIPKAALAQAQIQIHTTDRQGGQKTQGEKKNREFKSGLSLSWSNGSRGQCVIISFS